MNNKTRITCWITQEQRDKLDKIYAVYLVSGLKKGYGEILGDLIERFNTEDAGSYTKES